MILPDFYLETRKNCIWQKSGIDSPSLCRDKSHFKNYPHRVVYDYNSRGFRDSEWPNTMDELRQAIWCVGDSFTVGIGSPLENTWVHMLQKITGRRCINISLDGASNEWITRKTLDIINVIDPVTPIMIQYSFWHRWENPDVSLSDEDRRCAYELAAPLSELAERFIAGHTALTDTGKDIVFSSIPNGFTRMYASTVEVWDHHFRDYFQDYWIPCPLSVKEFYLLPAHVKEHAFKCSKLTNFVKMYEIIDSDRFYPVNQIDFARDYFHYDNLTAANVADYFASFVDV